MRIDSSSKYEQQYTDVCRVLCGKDSGNSLSMRIRNKKTLRDRLKRSFAKRVLKFFGKEIDALRKSSAVHPLVENMNALQAAEEKKSSILSRAAFPDDAFSAGSVMLDVGANTGALAKKFRMLFPEMKVEAVEADPATFEQLRTNTETDPDIRVHNRAIHSHSSSLPFYTHKNSLLSSLVNIAADEKETSCVMVEACSLDQFIAEQGIRNIALIKIDTEGNDLNVLRGASGILQSEALRYVILEFGISNTAQRHCYINDLVAELAPFGFSAKCFGDWGVYGSAIFGNCLFERIGHLSRVRKQ